nr:helitron helicase-like domain-containing protein [Tanacetum cinerariifolium]
MILTTVANIQALLGDSEDELKDESDDEVFEAEEEMDEDIQDPDRITAIENTQVTMQADISSIKGMVTEIFQLTNAEIHAHVEMEKRKEKAAQEANLLLLSKIELIKVAHKEATKVGVDHKALSSKKGGQEFLKTQDAKIKVLNREHYKKIKKAKELRKKRIDQWIPSSLMAEAMARKKNTNVGDDTQRQDECSQFTYGLQYNPSAEQLGLSPAMTKPDVLKGTSEHLGLSPVVTKTDPQVTPPFQEPVNVSIDVTSARLFLPPEHHVHDDVIVKNHRTIDRTVVPISTVFDCFRNLKMLEIQSNFVADTDVSNLYLKQRKNLPPFVNSMTQRHFIQLKHKKEIVECSIRSSNESKLPKCWHFHHWFQFSMETRLDEGGLNLEIVQGLVHVLDEHNDLVRLFRTTRDRCRVRDMPRFKIMLYSKGGVRGYELPTSGVLGGIVFEDGLKSRIDFDVIIEFRGEPP